MPETTAAAPTRFDHAKFGRLRRAWCEEHNLTPTDFAALVPISHPYLMRLESGKPEGNPSFQVLGNLARLLGVQPGELLIHPEVTDDDARELAAIGRRMKARGAPAEGAA